MCCCGLLLLLFKPGLTLSTQSGKKAAEIKFDLYFFKVYS
jgi:hypothetical protein